MKKSPSFRAFLLIGGLSLTFLLGPSGLSQSAAKQMPQEEAAESLSPIQEIYEADQKARQSQPASMADANLLLQGDRIRRQEARRLLDQGLLQTGTDFEKAAVILQHGSEPTDYLLAHVLAIVAVARGDSNAVWITAATLDRYLDSVKRPQVFGTQFHRHTAESWTQEPYDRNLVPDSLLTQLGIPAKSAQHKHLLDLIRLGNHDLNRQDPKKP
jgi:hypothetical protein